MNEYLRTIISAIKKKIAEEPGVLGIVVYGSIGRSEDDELSDIDMIIYLDNKLLGEKQQVVKKILSIVEALDGLTYWFKYRSDKYVIFTSKNHVWIEILIHGVNDIPHDIIYIIESRIKDPSNAVVYDKNGAILRLLRKYWTNPVSRPYINERINELVDHLIYYLRLFIHYRKRKDRFRAYMNYSIAMYKIAGILAAAYGEVYNLYSPWFLFEKVIDDKDLEKLYFDTILMFDESIENIKKKLFNLLSIVLKKSKLNNPLLYYKLKNAEKILSIIIDDKTIGA